MGWLRGNQGSSSHLWNVRASEQLERGCSVAGLYLRVPATGETGAQGHLLGRLSEPSCWGDLHCTYVHIYILTSRPASCSARERSRMSPLCCLCLCACCVRVCLCDLCGWPWLYIHMWHICVLCVRMPTGNTCLASLQIGPGGMVLCLPCPS